MNDHGVSGDDLARLELFRGLRPDQLAPLAAGARRRRLADGEVLFEQGRPARSMYAILSGHLALRAARGERSIIVQTLGPGEILGWSTLREEATSLTTGRAVGQVELVEFPSEQVLDLLASGSAEARVVIRRLFGIAAAHLDAAQSQLHRLGAEGVISGG